MEKIPRIADVRAVGEADYWFASRRGGKSLRLSASRRPAAIPLARTPAFSRRKVVPGGYGISWSMNLT